MKKLVLIISMFFLLGTTHPQYGKRMNKVITGELQQYIEEYYKDFPYATKAPVYVTPLAPRYSAGYADVYGNFVVLNARYFMKYHRNGKLKGLVYHELGHLTLDLAHTKNPKTIMSEGPYGELLITPKRIKIMQKRHLMTCLGYMPSLTDLMTNKANPPHKSCTNRTMMRKL